MAKFTPQQREVVEHDQGNILVSASAGSGKTHTMIERAKRLILEEKATVTQILAVTFTTAAAAQMREKLMKALSEKIAEGGAENFIEQFNQVPIADISTIHSFCGKLIRTYFYEVGLSPDFVVADESQSKVLKNESIDKVFKEFYESEEKWFLALVNRHRHKRNDKKFRTLILDSYEFIMSEPNPEETLNKYKYLYSEKVHFDILENYLQEHFASISSILKKAESTREKFVEYNMVKAIGLCDGLVNHILETLKEKTASNLLRKGKFEKRMDYDKSFPDELLPEKNLLNECKQEFNDIVLSIDAVFNGDKNLIRERLYDHTEMLVNVVRRFSEVYADSKREENLLDFNDLEHFALKVLSNDEICADVREKYKYVFVDECQDTNGVQDAILSKVSNDNLLMVGDVKQSIYGFRGCRPDLFEDKKKTMKKEGQKTVDLNENFRSSTAVINAVNEIFNYCMTDKYFFEGYKGKAELVPGGLFPDQKKEEPIESGGKVERIDKGEVYDEQTGDDGSGRAQFHFIEKQKKAEEVEEPRVYKVLDQAKKTFDQENSATLALVVEIINKELGKKYYDTKEKKFKQIGYGDIAILTRKKENEYVKSLINGLRNYGIDVVSDVKETVSDFPEIAILVNALKLIDCFRQDVPLASTLKSPIGNFTEEDLMEIAGFTLEETGDKSIGFSDSLDYYMKNAQSQLCERLKEFCSYFSKIRTVADFTGAFGALERIVRDKNIEADFYARTGGETKVSRLKRFMSAAKVGQKRLTVKEFLHKIENSEDAFGFAECASETAIRAMTVHKSKGLEFPVVIVCGLEQKFNHSDEWSEVLFSRKYGFAVKNYDDENKTMHETVLRALVKEEKKEELIKEEMRLFYVATTRAMYSLHLVGYGTDNRSEVFDGAKSFLDFIPKSMAKTEYFEDGFEFTQRKIETRKVLIGKSDLIAEAQMRERFSFVYPYLEETQLPLKTDVTTANKLKEDEQPKTVVLFDQENTSIERGNTAHKIMEHLDFNSGEFNGQVQKMISDKVITAEEVAQIDLERIEKAVSNDIFKGLKGKDIYREKSFIVEISANKIFDVKTNAPVVLQGIIDLLVIDGDTARVVDYKYSGKDKEGLKVRYKKQLELYSYAVEKLLNKKVVSKTIINLLTGEMVEL